MSRIDHYYIYLALDSESCSSKMRKSEGTRSLCFLWTMKQDLYVILSILHANITTCTVHVVHVVGYIFPPMCIIKAVHAEEMNKAINLQVVMQNNKLKTEVTNVRGVQFNIMSFNFLSQWIYFQ